MKYKPEANYNRKQNTIGSEIQSKTRANIGSKIQSEAKYNRGQNSIGNVCKYWKQNTIGSKYNRKQNSIGSKIQPETCANIGSKIQSDAKYIRKQNSIGSKIQKYKTETNFVSDILVGLSKEICKPEI